jgi:hypothetical protein
MINAAAYYEKNFVWDKHSVYDMNTVRFVVLSVKVRCALTSFSHSFQHILRQQQYQHDLFVALERRLSAVQSELEEKNRNERILEGHLRNLMASFGAIVARVGDHADLLDTILHRTDMARGSVEYLAKTMPSAAGAASKKFAMELHAAWEDATIPTYTGDEERDPAFMQAIAELQQTAQDDDIKEGMPNNTDDEWLLNNPKKSRATCYQNTNRRIAAAVGRSPVPVSVSETNFFQLSDEQLLLAEEESDSDSDDDEESRKRSRSPPESDYEIDSDEEPRTKRHKSLSRSYSE